MAHCALWHVSFLDSQQERDLFNEGFFSLHLPCLSIEAIFSNKIKQPKSAYKQAIETLLWGQCGLTSVPGVFRCKADRGWYKGWDGEGVFFCGPSELKPSPQDVPLLPVTLGNDA